MNRVDPDALVARRQELGLELEQIAHETKIPVRYLEAIEAGRLSELPSGPYGDAYIRAYREAVGVVTVPQRGRPVVPEVEPTTYSGYVALALVTVASVGMLWWGMSSVGVEESDEPAVVRLTPEETEPVGIPEVQRHQVLVEMRLSSPMTVVVDEEVLHQRVFNGGEKLEIVAEERVEIEVPAVNRIRVFHDGKLVVPQGNQHIPRRLVFIDDRGE